QSGAAPSRQLLVDLQAAWGNEGFAARTDYLQEVASRAATAKGAILECGSGLTTILLGSLAGRRGVETWSLEHMPEWHAQITETLRRHRVPKTNVCLAPLRHYGDFWWYDPPLNQMPATFNLIICDGPPGTTPGNRYGLLPVVGKRLGNDSLILLDDAQRPTEVAVLDRWAAEGQLKVDLREAPTGTFARVTLAAP
ncbi:MAG TPA: hypothetical protein VJS64_02250, partial [Pyrinomonadaceae bacterium]|nr:hypothetical protein [Pyrinomonadaceae bacterium]